MGWSASCKELSLLLEQLMVSSEEQLYKHTSEFHLTKFLVLNEAVKPKDVVCTEQTVCTPGEIVCSIIWVY
jgi:hypothetical protein